MSAPPRPRPVVILTSPSGTPCGVESFARRLAEAAGQSGLDARPLAIDGAARDLVALWRALRGAEALVVNLPIVAWKKALATPLLALLIARLGGARAIVVLHEWRDLRLMRRLAVALYVLAAEALLFSSPTVRREFEASPLARFKARGGLMPIPPNVAPPQTRQASALTRRMQAERARGTLILGHFGSIYPKKRCEFALSVAAEIKRAGRDVLVVYVGGAVAGEDDAAALLAGEAARLGLAEAYAISGYVEGEPELFALLEACDGFVYSFEGGLTSRRGSVLACLEAGRPVVVNAPERADEFDHHRVYRQQLASGALRLAPSEAAPADYARAILAAAAPGAARSPPHDLYAPGWRDAADALSGALA